MFKINRILSQKHVITLQQWIRHYFENRIHIEPYFENQIRIIPFFENRIRIRTYFENLIRNRPGHPDPHP